MTLKEFYDKIGGDYNGVMSRLMKEERVVKFVRRFLDDKSLATLDEKLAEGNYEEAFRAAHTIKGVASNLGFSRLLDSSNELTEELRGGTALANTDHLDSVRADYEQTIEAIHALEN